MMPLTWPAWVPAWMLPKPVSVPVAPAVPLFVPITLEQYMMGRHNDQRYVAEWTFEKRDNAIELLSRVNRVLAVFGRSRKVRSGWRPVAINHAVGGARNSGHIKGQAIDLDDEDRALHRWLDVGPDLTIRNPVALRALEEAELWIESPFHTDSWIHAQSKPPASGRRVFNP